MTDSTKIYIKEKLIVIIHFFLFTTAAIQESYDESSCSVVSAGMSSALRTGWYINVVNLEFGEVQKMECRNGKESLLDKEIKLIQGSLKELSTLVETMSVNNSNQKINKRFVMGAIALGVASGAMVTAGLALAKTVRLENDIKALKAATELTNQAVITLSNGVKVLTTALKELSDYVKNTLVPIINSLNCDVTDLRALIGLTQANRRLINVANQFSASAGVVGSVGLDMLTDAELEQSITQMPTSAGQISLMLKNKGIVRRNGFSILSSVSSNSLFYVVQLPIYGVIDTECWKTTAGIQCTIKDDKNLCLMRNDEGWYCKDAGGTLYFPNLSTCEQRDDRVFCDTTGGITVHNNVRFCNQNISTSLYPCKISTSAYPISMIAMTLTGAIVSCYGDTQCSVGTHSLGISGSLKRGCHFVSGSELDFVDIANSRYYINKILGQTITIKGDPVIESFDPITFPEESQNLAFEQVQEKIDETKKLIEKSNKELDKVGNYSTSTNYVLIIILFVVIVLIVLGIGGYIIYKKRAVIAEKMNRNNNKNNVEGNNFGKKIDDV